jgi:PAS domain S-box-containing protein
MEQTDQQAHADRLERTESELRRQAAQQAALAYAGQIALSNATLSFLFDQAAESVRRIFDADFCGIYKAVAGDHLLLVGGAGWPRGVVGSLRADLGRSSLAGYTFAVREPVIVADIATESRFTLSDFMIENGIVSAVTVPIESADDEVWGVLGAHSREPQAFGASQVDFLRTLASMLGQSIHRRRVEVELRIRAMQQSAIAEIGQRALTGAVDQKVLDRTCDLIIDCLGVEYSTYLEIQPDGQSLLYRAGHRWMTDPPRPLPLATTHAGLTIVRGDAVVIEDYEKAKDIDTHYFLPYGIRSGITVPVVGPGRKFGVLAAHTRALNRFGAGDVHFMQSLGALLGEVMARDAAYRDLVESGERVRSVFEGSSEVIFTMAVTGEFTSLNPAFEAITGWRCDEWIGRKFDALILPDQLHELRALFESVIAEPRSIRVEAGVRGKKGNVIVLAAAVSPKVVRGEVVEVYGFARDVTEERRLEADRNRATRELQLVLESTDEGIYATDMNGRCTLVNRSAAKMLAAARDVLLGSDIHSLIHPNEDECALAAVTGRRRSYSSRDDVFHRADGTSFPVEYSVSPIIDAGEVKGSVVAFEDISARRKLEAQLEQANRLSSLGRLAATVAHEFNNVLMGIAPFAEVLRREAVSERAATAVEQIARSVRRGKSITEDILRFTQPSEPVFAPFDADAWLDSVAFEARSLIGAKYAIIVIPPSHPIRIVGDAGQLHQSFINLILNARDAMPAGGPVTISVRRHDSASRFDFGVIEDPERFAHFIVEDRGEGMPPEVLRHIFEPLFTTKKTGTGLGLSVTRHVIANHGGEIFVESTVGAGTKFHLFIPLEEEQAAASAASATPLQARGQRPYHRVLIVEDERPVALGIASLLELEGLTVTIVETGREVLPAIAETKPDVVILDIGLPDIDGTKVFSAIAAEYPDLPVVFSSGHADESKLEKYLIRRHVGFLLKPYDIDALLATLDRVVT